MAFQRSENFPEITPATGSAAQRPPKTPAYTYLFSAILLCLLGILIYSNTFQSPFCFDDHRYIVGNFAIKNLSDTAAIWNFYPARFLPNLSFALNFHFNGLSVSTYHLVSLGLHLASTLLVWGLMLLTLSTPALRGEKIAGRAPWIAFFTGLIFVAHPLQTQAVNYITQRTVTMAAFFYLASLCLYIKARSAGQKGSASGAKRIYYILSLLMASLGMFTKETVITLPVMILLYEFSFLRVPGEGVRWRPALPFLLTLAFIPLTMLFTKPVAMALSPMSWGRSNFTSINYLWTEFRVIVEYIRLLFIPIDQNLDYAYPLVQKLFELPTLASLLLLIVVLALAVKLFARHRLMAFGIFWFFLTLSPESSLILLADPILEHRLYLPMAGFCIFLVSALYFFIKDSRFRIMIALTLILGCACSLLTYHRNAVWKDEISLWSDVIRKSPGNARAYTHRGIAYENRGDLARAVADYNKAIEVNPYYYVAYGSRGNICLGKGALEEALADYTIAITIKPEDPLNHNNRGLVYMAKNDLESALAGFNKALELDPNFYNAFYNRALVYVRQGQYDQALSDFDKALRLEPGSAPAYQYRALTYFFKKEYGRSWEDLWHAQSLGAKIPPEFIRELEQASGRKA
jgi:protein O-mannosyl-transferase